MTISSISSNNYYMGQMSAFGGRSAPTGTSGRMGQAGGRGQGPDPVEIFGKMDKDGSGGLDQSEFQILADKISEVTGNEVDAQTLFDTYDADGDGTLSEEETQTAMEANRPEGPPPGDMMGGMMGGMGGMGGMQGPPPPDFSEMFSDADENEDGSLDETEAQSLADIISEATGEEMDAADLLSTYDEDEDGVLSEEEAQTAMEANRPEGPPPPPQGAMTAEADGSQSSLSTGLKNYMKMAALGSEQDQGNSLFSLFAGENNLNYATSLFSVNTRV